MEYLPTSKGEKWPHSQRETAWQLFPILHAASGIGFIAPFARNNHAMRPAQNPKAKLPLWKIHQRCLSNASVGNKFDQKNAAAVRMSSPRQPCFPCWQAQILKPGCFFVTHLWDNMITWAFFGIQGTPPKTKRIIWNPGRRPHLKQYIYIHVNCKIMRL